MTENHKMPNLYKNIIRNLHNFSNIMIVMNDNLKYNYRVNTLQVAIYFYIL